MEQNLMLIKSTAQQIIIYVKSPKGNTTDYFRYNLQWFEKPFSDGGIYQNQAVWRLHEGYFYRQEKSGSLTQITPYAEITCGEWECAIRIEGAPDAFGGFHGYEKALEITANADGSLYDIANTAPVLAETFTFTQKSELYRQGTRNETIAHHLKKYCFQNGILKLHQELIWQKDVPVPWAYLAMLPIRRTSDDTADGIQITDRITINNQNQEYDIAKIGHMTGISTPEHATSGVTKATIWGTDSGVHAELRIFDLIGKDHYFFVQNTQAYNKLYYTPVGKNGIYHTQKGETWKFDSEYEIYRTE